jgi:ABC-type multidrug transport system ATPase subunit
VTGGPPAVAFDKVSKAFGTKQVLHHVSFEVGKGEALCLVGRSGTGKSVTLKLIVSSETGSRQDLDRFGRDHDSGRIGIVKGTPKIGISLSGRGPVRFANALREFEAASGAFNR